MADMGDDARRSAQGKALSTDTFGLADTEVLGGPTEKAVSGTSDGHIIPLLRTKAPPSDVEPEDLRRSIRRATLIAMFAWPAFAPFDVAMKVLLYPTAPLSYALVIRLIEQ